MQKQILEKLIAQIKENKDSITTLKAKVTKLENKLKTHDPRATYEYFESIDEDEKQIFLEKFKIGRDQLEKELCDALDYLRSKNKRYSDYRAFMSNWISRKHARYTDKEIQRSKDLKERVDNMKKRLGFSMS